MFYAEPLDVAPSLLKSVVDIVNDAGSFRWREPGVISLCGFHADFAVECLGDRQVLLCFGCGEAILVTGSAHDHVDLNSAAYQRLTILLAGVRQSRPPEQFDDPVKIDPADLEYEGPDRAAPATRSSWNILPPPRARAPLAFRGEYSQAEFERLQQGLVPADMDDKWFVFFEEPWLYFHRSWSGACTFAVRLVPVPDGATAAEAWVTRKASEYKGTDAGYDTELLRFLVDALLLGRNASFPVPTGGDTSAPGVLQANLVGTAYPEVPFTQAPARSRFRAWVERLRS